MSACGNGVRANVLDADVVNGTKTPVEVMKDAKKAA
jgi:hypothetical protein